MKNINEIVRYCDQRLSAAEIKDYCPNGLQVEAVSSVSKIVSGVTASLEMIEAAAEAKADLLLVHHGYFWKGEAEPLTGMKGRRVKRLFESGMNLLAYHLPLDRHSELGNNRQLGEKLGFTDVSPIAGHDDLLWQANLEGKQTVTELASTISSVLQREPLVLGDDKSLNRVAWCTGGAQSYIEKAAAEGCDLFISGEVSEQTMHLAKELGITYIAAGHHATERYGVQALAAELSAKFSLQHEYIDIYNPV